MMFLDDVEFKIVNKFIKQSFCFNVCPILPLVPVHPSIRLIISASAESN